MEFDTYAIRSTCCTADQDRSRRRVLVRLNRDAFAGLKQYFLHQATRHHRASLEAMFWSLGLYPYRPVIGQLFTIVRAVNRTRRRLGLEEVDPKRCVRCRKPPLRVF